MRTLYVEARYDGLRAGAQRLANRASKQPFRG